MPDDELMFQVFGWTNRSPVAPSYCDQWHSVSDREPFTVGEPTAVHFALKLRSEIEVNDSANDSCRQPHLIEISNLSETHLHLLAKPASATDIHRC